MVCEIYLGEKMYWWREIAWITTYEEKHIEKAEA